MLILTYNSCEFLFFYNLPYWMVFQYLRLDLISFKSAIDKTFINAKKKKKEKENKHTWHLQFNNLNTERQFFCKGSAYKNTALTRLRMGNKGQMHIGPKW